MRCFLFVISTFFLFGFVQCFVSKNGFQRIPLKKKIGVRKQYADKVYIKYRNYTFLKFGNVDEGLPSLFGINPLEAAVIFGVLYFYFGPTALYNTARDAGYLSFRYKVDSHCIVLQAASFHNIPQS